MVKGVCRMNAKPIWRENGVPIKWKCNGFVIEKYYIENLDMYTYGVGAKELEDVCFNYHTSLNKAITWCSMHDVNEVVEAIASTWKGSETP
jgi:hypothetical protein